MSIFLAFIAHDNDCLRPTVFVEHFALGWNKTGLKMIYTRLLLLKNCILTAKKDSHLGAKFSSYKVGGVN